VFLLEFLIPNLNAYKGSCRPELERRQVGKRTKLIREKAIKARQISLNLMAQEVEKAPDLLRICSLILPTHRSKRN
jgi:hypothetical protein